MKRWIKKIPPFIRRNVRSRSFVIALLKTAIVAIPLLVGLKDYSPTSVEFCKSVFLYAVPVVFDTACFLFIAEDSTVSTPEEGCLLKFGMGVLFLGSLLLSGLSLVGIFEHTWFCSIPWVVRYSQYVYPIAFFEAVWYGAESVSLFFLLLIPRKHKNDVYDQALTPHINKSDI